MTKDEQEDLDYFKRKLFKALRVPAGYLYNPKTPLLDLTEQVWADEET